VSRRKRKIRKKTARKLEPAESVFGLFGVPLAKAPIGFREIREEEEEEEEERGVREGGTYR
jgi:hypothetical protein